MGHEIQFLEELPVGRVSDILGAIKRLERWSSWISTAHYALTTIMDIGELCPDAVEAATTMTEIAKKALVIMQEIEAKVGDKSGETNNFPKIKKGRNYVR